MTTTALDARITGLRHWLIHVPFHRRQQSASSRREGMTRLVVEITTDAGVTGYGESICLLGFIEPVLTHVVAPLAIGKSVSAVEQLYRHVLGAGYYHHKRAAVMALCAVEMAMWDVQGKLARAPLSRLWGGMWRERVGVAAYLLIADPGQLVEAAQEFRSQGFEQFKIKIGSGARLDIELVAAARKVLGEGIHLRADVNGAWSRPTARRQLERLRGFDLAFVEQPLEMDDLEGHAELRRCQPVPIALDESAYTLHDLANIVRAGAADVVLLDAHEAGGMWQARKMAAVAEAFGLETGVHSGGELGLSQAANLHLAASTPDMKIAIDTMYFNYRDDILTERLRAEGGAMAVPTGPGLGVAPDLDKLERYRTDTVRGAYLDPDRAGWFPMKPSY